MSKFDFELDPNSCDVADGFKVGEKRFEEIKDLVGKIGEDEISDKHHLHPARILYVLMDSGKLKSAEEVLAATFLIGTYIVLAKHAIDDMDDEDEDDDDELNEEEQEMIDELVDEIKKAKKKGGKFAGFEIKGRVKRNAK